MFRKKTFLDDPAVKPSMNFGSKECISSDGVGFLAFDMSDSETNVSESERNHDIIIIITRRQQRLSVVFADLFFDLVLSVARRTNNTFVILGRAS